jgi:hypothetical protein
MCILVLKNAQISSMLLYRTECLFYLIIITDHFIKCFKVPFGSMSTIVKLKSPISTKMSDLLTLHIFFNNL